MEPKKNLDKYMNGFATKCVHAGIEPDPLTGAIMTPIYMSSTFAVTKPGQEYLYGRLANPTRTALEKSLATLEQGKHALITSSGMGAANIILHLLKAGDHLIASNDLYGGVTNYLLDLLPNNMGVKVDFEDLTDPNVILKMVKPESKMVWIETPTNPMLRIYDIEAIAKICKEKKLILVVDNTFMSPYLQNPLVLGATIVMHSCTKYIGGHSDIIMGAVILSDDEIFKRLNQIYICIGPCPSPFDCFLALRGIKTLPLRVEYSQKTTMLLAEILEKHPKIDSLIYPGLSTHPGHELMKKQAKGFGAMISFRVKGDMATAKKFCESLTLFQNAVSLGGIESLVTIPVVITHKAVPMELRKKLGLTDNLVRISIGVESFEDLRDDLLNALKQIQVRKQEDKQER